MPARATIGVLGAAILVVVATSTYGSATAQHQPATPEAELAGRARSAVTQLLQGDLVKVKRKDKAPQAYKVDFLRDGSTLVGVRLDREFNPVAGNGGEHDGAPASPAEIERARAAARALDSDLVKVKRVGERGRAKGKAYEVRFSRPDGSTEELRLDAGFEVLEREVDVHKR